MARTPAMAASYTIPRIPHPLRHSFSWMLRSPVEEMGRWPIQALLWLEWGSRNFVIPGRSKEKLSSWAAGEGPRVSPPKSQRANSLARTRPQLTEFSKIWGSAPDHNLALRNSLESASGTHTSLASVPACRMSFFSPCRLQSPEVSLVSDSLAGFDSALFSERFLFRCY
jgi:hypothetical protein